MLEPTGHGFSVRQLGPESAITAVLDDFFFFERKSQRLPIFNYLKTDNTAFSVPSGCVSTRPGKHPPLSAPLLLLYPYQNSNALQVFHSQEDRRTPTQTKLLQLSHAAPNLQDHQPTSFSKTSYPSFFNPRQSSS